MLSFFGTELSGPIPRRAFYLGDPGNGTRRAGTIRYRRNDSVGFFFSPVTIILLQRIRTKTSFDQFCIRFINSNLSSAMIVGARAQRTIDQSQT